MKEEGVVYEGARAKGAEGSGSNIPPFPDCEPETIEAVSAMLKSGESARFLSAEGKNVELAGFSWNVVSGIGTLTKL